MQSDRGLSVVREARYWTVTHISAVFAEKDITHDVERPYATYIKVFGVEKVTKRKFQLQISTCDIVAMDFSRDSQGAECRAYCKIARIYRVGKTKDFCFSYYPITFLGNDKKLYTRQDSLMGGYGATTGNDVGMYTFSHRQGGPRLFSVLRILNVIKGATELPFRTFPKLTLTHKK